jgi:hypothetical protein
VLQAHAEVGLFAQRYHADQPRVQTEGRGNSGDALCHKQPGPPSEWTQAVRAVAGGKEEGEGGGGGGSTFHVMPKKLSEHHGSTSAAEIPQDGHHRGRSVGARINSANGSHTGPDFEAKFSGSPALPCPTAKHSSKSEPSSQKIRREDQPMGLSPEALELRCLWQGQRRNPENTTPLSETRALQPVENTQITGVYSKV